MSRLLRRAVAAGAAMLIGGIGGMATVGSQVAEAAVVTTINATSLGGSGGYIREHSSTRAWGTYVSNGYRITVLCQTLGAPLGDGGKYTNNATWDLIQSGSSYRWVHDVITNTAGNGGRQYVGNGIYITRTNGLPDCNSSQFLDLRERAVTQALSTVGHVWAQDTGMAGYFNDWAPGDTGEWSYDCVKLVRASYLKLGSTPRSAASATALWRTYGAPSRRDTPPPGAFVFYPNKNHIAISMGRGLVVSTDGPRDNSYYTNKVMSTDNAYAGNMTGWAMP